MDLEDLHPVEPSLAPLSPGHMFQNATQFGIERSHFTNVAGDVNIHPTPVLPDQSQTTQPSGLNVPDDVHTECEIYCSQLQRKGRGFPLYVPNSQSNLPEEYQKRGIAIGDVGSVTPEGIFDFYFNIYLSSNHPINENLVPEEFTPFPIYLERDTNHLDYDPGEYVASPSVHQIKNGFPSGDIPGQEFRFNCVGPTGAVLALPHGAHLEKLKNLENLRRYAIHHANNWYKYINGARGRGLINGSLYLITGCEKSQSWGIASFQHVVTPSEFALSFKPTTDEQSQYLWERGTPAHTKKSAPLPIDELPSRNQTTFIQGFKIALGMGIWAKMFGGPMVSQFVDVESGDTGSSGGGFVPFSSQNTGSSWALEIFQGFFAPDGHKKTSVQDGHNTILHDISPNYEIFHPSQLIMTYLLEKAPEAQVIIAHDDDWCDILYGDDAVVGTDTPLLMQKIPEHFSLVKENGAVFLMPISKSEQPERPGSPIHISGAAGMIKDNRQEVFEDLPHDLDKLEILAATLLSTSPDLIQTGQRKQVEIDVNKPGSEHADILPAMITLIPAKHDQFGNAEKLEIELRMQINLLRDDHPDTLQVMGNLAETYNDLGHFHKAKKLQVELFRKRKDIMGQDHPHTLLTMENLAITYSHLRQFKKAEDLVLFVLETRRTVLGEDHPDMLHSMGNLAILYNHLGQFQKAKELEITLLNKRKDILGLDHPHTLLTMGNLAITYYHLGQFKKTEDLVFVVLERRRKVLGENHPDTLHAMSDLAGIYYHVGQFKKAEELEITLLNKRKGILGPYHPHTLLTMENLAITYYRLGQFKRAENFALSVLERQSNILGEEHPTTLRAMGNLAMISSRLGKNEEVEELLIVLIKKQRAVVGEGHPDTLHSMGCLAITYNNLDRFVEAEKLGLELLKERHLLHDDYMSAMNNLARTYNHLGIYKEAEKLAVVVLAHQSKFLNKNGQTHTLHALNNLALTYRHLGHLKAAKMLEVVVLKMKKTTVSLWPI